MGLQSGRWGARRWTEDAGSAYEKPGLWLGSVRGGVLDDTAIATFFHTS